MATRVRARLAEYERKRDFTATSEPSGKPPAKRPAAKKKAPARRAAAKKSAARKTAAKKTAAKRATAKRTTARAPQRPIFVVQHHKASHDHHDFRLEHRGVLLSWAVPKHVGTKGERRLAVQVEDHPLDYATFQGTIPKGNYGAGTVRTWDIGHWEPEGDVDEGLERGKLSFTLHGVRLKGEWTLVRMAPRPGESPTKPQWLLMRHHQGK